ncbi:MULTISPECIES: hypothetical protein [unclassified Rhodococcus (in: high G+C Gram-positive bacteria)]|uniref:hypothetical protein n=1 Tax=unclassified Rhodococcus (in: high G+C Gram-positive bacteria) TaxID=192944 RepID=UPI00163B409C|nr:MULTISPECIES: hypothetical protein [unclassified Rhodococcus (in: high G+C Gram-positive bacteria)]MBC2641901.1 hypothetical protein [Rhodococcus sp. 3A]MBC2893356.1 hypothetical protein [Rhodococcus sp. 4CII]
MIEDTAELPLTPMPAPYLVDLAAGSSPCRRTPGAVRFDDWEQLLTQLPHRHAYAS